MSPANTPYTQFQHTLHAWNFTHRSSVYTQFALAAAEVLSEWLKPSMALWMSACFEVAAARRFEALSIACERGVTGCTGQTLNIAYDA